MGNYKTDIALFTQELWQKEAGINLTLKEAQEVASNLSGISRVLLNGVLMRGVIATSSTAHYL